MKAYGGSGDDIFQARNQEYINPNKIIVSTVYLDGGAGNDTLIGGTAQDTLIGGEGDDYLNGGYYEDRLEGGAGNDILLGGRQNDVLIGGSGSNRLSGGSGADEFIFTDFGAADTITDFEIGVDKINLQEILKTVGLAFIDLNGSSFSRIRYLSEMSYNSAGIHFAQNGANTEVFLSIYATSKSTEETTTLIVLEGVDLLDLSFSDFTF
ncbi:MAG: type I secretion C-terminal target domain-containing protein [Alphaproteobacteria bacterium]|nr:type I secretion C-terminal target domain-containing protein [Alphaproteobacteria bacterium]